MNQTTIKLFKLYYISTFIGTVAHEMAHKKFAQERGLKIKKVEYFNLDGGSLGKVVHSPPRTYGDVFAVSVAPFVFNTSIGVVALLGSFILQSVYLSVYPQLTVVGVVFLWWFGGSSLLHAFPSSVDIGNITKAVQYLWEESNPSILSTIQEKIRERNIVIKIVLFPLTTLLVAIHVGSFAIRYLNVIVTLPAIYTLKIFNKGRKYGSHIYYATAVVVVTHQYILPEALETYNRLLIV